MRIVKLVHSRILKESSPRPSVLYSGRIKEKGTDCCQRDCTVGWPQYVCHQCGAHAVCFVCNKYINTTFSYVLKVSDRK